jgi:reactive chlorine resistance protein C
MTGYSDRLRNIGQGVMRYALVLFFVGFGLYKFTAEEAAGIQPLFFSWLYALFSVQGASNLIGVVEIVAGALIASRRWLPQMSAIGSLIAAFALVGTLSFLFTTPDLTPDLQGFLLKDLALLGIALWTAGEALQAHMVRQTTAVA